VMQLKMIIPVN